MIKVKFIVLVLLLINAAPSYSESSEEVIRGVIFNKNSLVFIVNPNGCTNKDSFKLNKSVSSSFEYYLTLERVKQDHCSAFFPEGVNIIYTQSEIGNLNLGTISILNDFEFP